MIIKISNEIQKLISVSNIESSILSQTYDTNNEVSKLAKKYNISEEKVNLINKELNSGIKNFKGNSYEFLALVNLLITKLNLLLKSKKIKVDSIISSGNSSDKVLIGKKAKSIAFNAAKVSKVTDLELELNSEKGILIYDVEFKFNKKEYEYNIYAKTGKIIFFIIEEDDND